MYKKNRIAAIIPARKGSKGIPNKNIVQLMGIPLIEHSLIQAQKSDFLDLIIVSTDSEDIIAISKKYEVEINGLRPEKFSNDMAKMYDVLKYEIVNHRLIERNYDIIVLLQPTSPLRQSYMIDQAIKKFVDEKQESAVSVSDVGEHPLFIRSIDENGKLKGIINMKSEIRRQDLPKYYIVNGMIYINKISQINEKYVSLNDNISPIIIPKELAVDIDDLDDLKEAEKMLKLMNTEQIQSREEKREGV